MVSSRTAAESAVASDASRARRRQVESVLAELLESGLSRGFFGSMSVSMAFHDRNIHHSHQRM